MFFICGLLINGYIRGITKYFTMKKITLLLGLAFLAFSCSSDDSGDNENNVLSQAELLIGTWDLIEESEDGVLVDLGECGNLGQLIFEEEEFLAVGFFENEESNECEIDGFSVGTYVVNENEATIMSFDQQVPVEEREEREGSFTFTVTESTLTVITFRENDEGVDNSVMATSVYTRSSDEPNIESFIEENVVEEPTTAELLVGTWVLSQILEDNIEVELEPCDDLQTLVFRSDVASFFSYEEDVPGECRVDFRSEFLYSVSGDVLTTERLSSFEAGSDGNLIELIPTEEEEEQEEESFFVFTVSDTELTTSFEQEEDVEDEDGNLVRDEDGNRLTEIVNFTEVYTRVTE